MKQRSLITFLVLMILVISGLIAAILIITNINVQRTDVRLYFLNSGRSSIESEIQSIKYVKDEEFPVQIVSAMLDGPERISLERIADKDTDLNSIKYVNENDVVVDFSETFYKDNAVENTLSVYAVAKTLCGTDHIERVKVTVNGNDITATDGTAIGFIDGNVINMQSEGEANEYSRVVLYYPRTDNSALKGEIYNIPVGNGEKEEEYILRALIETEPQEEMYSPFKEDMIISAEIQDGTCYINIDEAFIEKNRSSEQEEHLLICSVVNTLTENSGAEYVRFLFGGRKYPQNSNNIMFGGYDMTQSLTRDESVINNI